MKIELKYNEGDEVWYIRNNKIKSTNLYHGFRISCKYAGYSSNWGGKAFPIVIDYLIERADRPDNDFWLNENHIFPSKQELIKTL